MNGATQTKENKMKKSHGYKVTTKNIYRDNVIFLIASSKKDALARFATRYHTDDTTTVENVSRKKMVSLGFSKHF